MPSRQLSHKGDDTVYIRIVESAESSWIEGVWATRDEAERAEPTREQAAARDYAESTAGHVSVSVEKWPVQASRSPDV